MATQNPWDMKWEAAPAPKAGSPAASSAAPWEMNWEAQKQVSRDKPAANAPGYLETADVALGDGVTFQNRDELEGAGAVLTTPNSWAASLGLTKGPTIRDVYIAKRDEERRRSEAAQLANPKTYAAANFTGAAIPVVAATVATGGAAIPTIAATTAAGAAYGSGNSKADNPTDVALDALEGGAYGLAGGVAGRALATPTGKVAAKDTVDGALSVGKWIFKKLADSTKSAARSAWNTAKYGAIAYGADQATDGGIRNYLFGQAGVPTNTGGGK